MAIDSRDDPTRRSDRATPRLDARGVASRSLRLAAVAVPAFVILFFTNVPVCPFAIVTHHPCPACGITRAVAAAAHGDLVASFHHHPLALVVAPLVGVAVARDLLEWVRGAPFAGGASVPRRSKRADVVYAVVGVAVIVVWIARFFGAFGGPEPVG